MDQFKQIIHIIFITGASQGIILSFVLLTNSRGNKKANKILGLKIFIFSLVIFLYFFKPTDTSHICFLCTLVQTLLYLIGPLFYLYIVTLITSNTLNIRKLIHFVPFTLLLFFYLVYYIMELPLHNLSKISPYITQCLLLHFLFYNFISFFKLQKYSSIIKETFSNIDKINLCWLKILTVGFITISMSGVVFSLFVGRGYILWGLISILFSLFLYIMGYYSLKQPEIISGVLKIYTDTTTKKSSGKYLKTSLKQEDITKFIQRIEHFMRNNKPYLENSITLQKLSSYIKIPSHHLSQIINDKFNMNFYEFINSWRIKKAKELLHSDSCRHMTISAIAFDIGFNSISTFNSAFKKNTGQTPSQYRSEIRN